MRTYSSLFCCLILTVCGCKDSSAPVQPSGASKVSGIVWVNLPTQFNIAVPELSHKPPQKVGYKVTGQLIDKKGKPLAIPDVNLVCVAAAPNCDPTKEVPGAQNVFVFKPSEGRPIVGPPGNGVFQGQKVEAGCCYIQTSQKTDANGQFTLEFFVDGPFYYYNQIKLDIAVLLFREDKPTPNTSSLIRVGLSWRAIMPQEQDIFFFSKDSKLSGQPQSSIPDFELPELKKDCYCEDARGEQLPAGGCPPPAPGDEGDVPPTLIRTDCGCEQYVSDEDGDGVPDCLDICPQDPLIWESPITPPCVCGNYYNPNQDSDFDGTPDCSDSCPFNPLFSEGIPPCGCTAGDADGDGTPDCIDVCWGPDRLDTDGDGTPDCLDGCPNDPMRTFSCFDRDVDGDVDEHDVVAFEQCATSPGITQNNVDCLWADGDQDSDVDQVDLGIMQVCLGTTDAKCGQ